MESEPVPDIAGREPYITRPHQEASKRPDANQMYNVTSHILQSILAESPYKPDPEWQIFHRSRELEDTDMLPEGVTAQDIMDCFYRVFHYDD